MRVALYGGTFDPVHLGHLQVARAARERFRLDRVYFVPTAVPPHKTGQTITAFSHRYAMVALATAAEPTFFPSLLESPDELPPNGANYTIDTVRRLRRTLGARDRLFFILGMDAFADLGKWRETDALLAEVEFIVVSRPGFTLPEAVAALPERWRPAIEGRGRRSSGLAGIHLLDDLAENISATAIRNPATRRRLDQQVGPEVAAYIRKQGLYREPAGRKQPPVG